MSIERIARTIPPIGELRTGGNNFALFITSNAAVTLRAERTGMAEVFAGITGGLLLKRLNPWDDLRLIGAAGTSVEILVGTEIVDKDETDIRLQIATIAGVASVAINPTVVPTDRAPVTVSNAIQTVPLFAANGLRRKLRVFVDENNQDTCYVHTTGGAQRIANLQPGSVYTFDGIYGLDIERAAASGGNCIFYIFEEA